MKSIDRAIHAPAHLLPKQYSERREIRDAAASRPFVLGQWNRSNGKRVAQSRETK
jgi:hypothetical protein